MTRTLHTVIPVISGNGLSFEFACFGDVTSPCHRWEEMSAMDEPHCTFVEWMGAVTTDEVIEAFSPRPWAQELCAGPVSPWWDGNVWRWKYDPPQGPDPILTLTYRPADGKMCSASAVLNFLPAGSEREIATDVIGRMVGPFVAAIWPEADR